MMFSDHNHALKVELRIREYANEAKKNLIFLRQIQSIPHPNPREAEVNAF